MSLPSEFIQFDAPACRDRGRSVSSDCPNREHLRDWSDYNGRSHESLRVSINALLLAEWKIKCVRNQVFMGSDSR
jgi:hypothetical protein